jgi:ABC-type cobalamin/Fe3+-siderophores transport system ATPase subunit
VISVSGLSFRRDGGFTLRVDSLQAADGQVCALVGKNGCGKSTLLRCLAGILPYEGSALVDGREVRGLGHRERARRLAYLPQDPGCPHMDVRTLVSHGRYATLGAVRTMGERDRALVRRAMGLTGVWQLRDRWLSDVSGGELQLAYIAMVVAQDSGTLLLDEPSAHLDALRRRELADLLRRLAGEGLAVVVATHDVEAAFSSSDQVCLMAEGDVVARGTPEEVAASGRVPQALGVGVERQEGPGLLWGYALTRT